MTITLTLTLTAAPESVSSQARWYAAVAQVRGQQSQAIDRGRGKSLRDAFDCQSSDLTDLNRSEPVVACPIQCSGGVLTDSSGCCAVLPRPEELEAGSGRRTPDVSLYSFSHPMDPHPHASPHSPAY